MHKPLRFFLLISFCIISTEPIYSQLPNFSQAEGFGSTTPGGRGGKVIKVTNLNDRGSGSLRNALNDTIPRIIVFTTGGIINLETPLLIKNPFVTIAGQTAPGGGICIRGNGIKINTHDVVIRHLRIRPGDINFGKLNNWSDVDALTIGTERSAQTYNILIDHCSLSWGVDEVIGIWNGAHDITIQYSIIAEALNKSQHPKGEHGMGVLIGGGATRISMHHNLIANNEQRNPRLRSEKMEVDFRNNIIYNPGGTAVDIGDSYSPVKYYHLNFVGNTIVRGMNTAFPHEIVIRRYKDKDDWLQLFLEDNRGFIPGQDDWRMVKDSNGMAISDKRRKGSPFPFPTISTQSAEEAYELVLQDAGASLPLRDPVDRKIIRDLRSNKGKTINSRRHPLQWPPMDQGIARLDFDEDGMSDEWEERYSLNPNSSPNNSDALLDTDGDGYTNIEEFINNTNPLSGSNITLLSSSSPAAAFFMEQSGPPFSISQNYPNPFTDFTDIDFSVPEAAHVSLRIINNEGIVVQELINNFLYEGNYHITWDGTNLDAGIYNVVLGTTKGLKFMRTVLRKE